MKLFHQLLSKALKEFLAKVLFRRVSSVSTEEITGRFIFSSSHFNSLGAKYAAFMPRNGETSVFCISSISNDEIWDIGVNHVGKNMEPSLKARADIICGRVQEIGLDVISETSTHPLHANIINWPIERDEKLELAIDLAKASTFHKKIT